MGNLNVTQKRVLFNIYIYYNIERPDHTIQNITLMIPYRHLASAICGISFLLTLYIVHCTLPIHSGSWRLKTPAFAPQQKFQVSHVPK